MRSSLKLEKHGTSRRIGKFLKFLVEQIEELGVIVMRNKVVRFSRSRKLKVDDFRGFALVDELVPVIFINSVDCPRAQVFTLVHELSHIWIGQSGISNEFMNSNYDIEEKCDAVAAETLVPQDQFLAKWKIDSEDIESQSIELAKQFGVSSWVIARRARTLNLISSEQYSNFLDLTIPKESHGKKKASGFVNPFYVQTQRISKLVAQAVVSEALSGRMLLRDAWSLIGVKPQKLNDYAKTIAL